MARRHVAADSGDTSQVLKGLRWIVESAQCDCVICEIATAAIAEIERLRAAGDMLADVMVSGTADGWVEAFDAWEATRA